MSTNRLIRRAGRVGVVIAATGLATLLLGSGAASAHVTAKVIGESAKQGGYTKITFRVPNEDPSAGTVKLEIRLPKEYPMSSVRTKPTAGWSAQVTKVKLDQPVTVEGSEITEAVSTVTWTASSGTKIGPGEFGEFEVSAGRLPKGTDKLVIPAVQTYDSGKVVNWDAPPPAPGGQEPDSPAPVVPLEPASGDDHGAAPANAPVNAAPGQGSSDTTAAASDGSDNTARWLGGAGLVVGALGLGVGAGATMRARRAIAASKQVAAS